MSSTTGSGGLGSPPLHLCCLRTLRHIAPPWLAERTIVVRGEQLRDGGEEVPLVLYCLIDGCLQAERLQLLHSMPDVSPARPLLLPQ